jgi:hypothetical protein
MPVSERGPKPKSCFCFFATAASGVASSRARVTGSGADAPCAVVARIIVVVLSPLCGDASIERAGYQSANRRLRDAKGAGDVGLTLTSLKTLPGFLSLIGGQYSRSAKLDADWRSRRRFFKSIPRGLLRPEESATTVTAHSGLAR